MTLAGFDRIVIAIGAAYPARSGALVWMPLRSGLARQRAADCSRIAPMLPAGPAVQIIGDAAPAGRVDRARREVSAARFYT